MRAKYFPALLVSVLPAFCQTRPDMQEIMRRLERLEEQNRELMQEIRSLKKQLSDTPPGQSRGAEAQPAQGLQPEAEAQPSIEERVAVAERRVEELEQSKAGAEQRLPLTLT